MMLIQESVYVRLAIFVVPVSNSFNMTDYLGWSLGLWWSGCYGSTMDISEAKPLEGKPTCPVDDCCRLHGLFS